MLVQVRTTGTAPTRTFFSHSVSVSDDELVIKKTEWAPEVGDTGEVFFLIPGADRAIGHTPIEVTDNGRKALAEVYAINITVKFTNMSLEDRATLNFFLSLD